MSTQKLQIQVLCPIPDNFHSFTRGCFQSEVAAIRACRKRGDNAVVGKVPANRSHEECWYVGYLKVES